RITDTNGNSIRIDGQTLTDEQTSRQISYSYDASANNGQGQGQVHYKTVTGVDETINLNFGTSTVQGKIYTVDDWNYSGGERGGGVVCHHDQLLSTNISVIRSIVFPTTESGIAPRQFSFAYNSDTTDSVTDTVQWACGQSPQSYTRDVSHGTGQVSQVTT